jgi:hypothetical protein
MGLVIHIQAPVDSLATLDISGISGGTGFSFSGAGVVIPAHSGVEHIGNHGSQRHQRIFSGQVGIRVTRERGPDYSEHVRLFRASLEVADIQVLAASVRPNWVFSGFSGSVWLQRILAASVGKSGFSGY